MKMSHKQYKFQGRLCGISTLPTQVSKNSGSRCNQLPWNLRKPSPKAQNIEIFRVIFFYLTLFVNETTMPAKRNFYWERLCCYVALAVLSFTHFKKRRCSNVIPAILLQTYFYIHSLAQRANS